MERRRLGDSDLTVSSLCLGTMTWGEQNSEAEAHAQMDAAFDRGVDFFDAAEAYPIPMRAETGGLTERFIGSWLSSRRVRPRLVLATKVCGRSDRLVWMREGGAPPRLTRMQITQALEGSLRRLGTDCIDLYQVHWPDRPMALFGGLGRPHPPESGGEPIEETLAVLDDLKAAGKIRAFGISNETPWGVMSWLHAAETSGRSRPATLQNAYNALNRTDEIGMTEIVHREGLGYLAYSPLAQGYLSGKYLDGAAPPKSRKACFGPRTRYETTNAEAAIRGYLEVARRFDLDPAAMANQFVTTRSFVTSNIIGARTMDQLETALSSVEIAMTEALEAELEAVHLRFSNPCP